MDFAELQHAFPLLILLLAGVLALLGDLFLSHRKPAIAYVIVQGALLLMISYGFRAFLSPEAVGFHGLFVDDQIARLLTIFILIVGFVCFWYSRLYVEEHDMPTGEYYVLGLMSILGMMVLVSAHSLLTIYLGLELLSLPLYAMVALRRDEGSCQEAALKYFIMGAVASGILLYGLSLFYGATGQLDLAEIANVITQIEPAKRVFLNFALIFIITGFGFKLAAVPFHMWAPDVYTGAPTSVTLFLGTAPKLAAFGMAVRLLTFGFPDLLSTWQPILIVIAILSMGLGNLLAIAQTNIKRMLAYSAIAHTGYMLLGLIAGSVEGYSAALFYILNYALMSMAAFGMLTILSRRDSELENIDDFRGLGTRQPWLALMMMLIMLSMAGLPPLVGFFAKLFVLKALVDVNLVWLAVTGLLFAVWGAFYYIRIIKVLYFEAAPDNALPLTCTYDQKVILSINSLSLLLLGLFPGLILHACQLTFGG